MYILKFAVSVFMAAMTCVAAANERPDTVLSKASADLMSIARSDADVKAGDMRRIRSLVEQKLVPLMDFDKITSLASGRHWKSATPEQRAALKQEFSNLLINTYAATISQLRDKEIVFQPLRASDDDTDVIVRSTIVGGNKSTLAMDYRMEKKDGSWKVYDVNILGAWLVETYKASFNTEISRSGFDGLVTVLRDKNLFLAKKLSGTNKVP